MELDKLPIGEVINDGNILLIYYPNGNGNVRNYIPVSAIMNYKISMDTERTYYSNNWPTDKSYYYITIYVDKTSWSFGYSYDYDECVKTLETLLDKIYPKKPQKKMITMPN